MINLVCNYSFTNKTSMQVCLCVFRWGSIRKNKSSFEGREVIIAGLEGGYVLNAAKTLCQV